MKLTEHTCEGNPSNKVPNDRFKIESWDVMFGGRVTGLIDYFKNGMPVKYGYLISHVNYCPFCGVKV